MLHRDNGIVIVLPEIKRGKVAVHGCVRHHLGKTLKSFVYRPAFLLQLDAVSLHHFVCHVPYHDTAEQACEQKDRYQHQTQIIHYIFAARHEAPSLLFPNH